MGELLKFKLIIASAILALFFNFGLGLPVLAFVTVAIVGGLLCFFMLFEMFKTIRSGSFGVDILAVTAIFATLALKEYWASLMILIMLTGGDALENYATQKAAKELKKLLDNSPQKAHQLVDDKFITVNVATISVGDHLLVKPGETVPVDATIIKGSSMFDVSSLTGESMPILKTINDTVLSGTINGDSPVMIVADKTAQDSQYQTIINLVRLSANQPAHFVRMADRYAVPFTLIAYIIAGLAWFYTKDASRFADVLVVASPCPLILAAPIALISGMSRSSRNGVIVKTGTALELLAKAETIAFDKTGTITQGTLSVDKLISLAELDEMTVLSYAASLEVVSNHILAKSLVLFAKDKVELFPVEELEEVIGQGIKGKINQQFIRVGKHDFVTNDKSSLATSETTVYISVDGQLIGYITFTDSVRDEAAQTIERLKRLGIKQFLMLSGDHQQVAKTISGQVGITEVYADCLPQDKTHILAQIKKDNRPVVMVGDGINDSPALALADVGIAMGINGVTAASESADVVILKDDLTSVAEIIVIAKDTLRIAKQSVLIGIMICIVLMMIASFGVIPALFGAILQEVIDTVAILSALRARKKRH
ncbi:MAG: cadmium-translocating P-type ATPase [Streptococcaceae bacterium]|jgi:heavy metal translocating P-type ATPase|nr:cadmium-translocating P-type ATPase [Streptococcaceae bacterium]